jgi:2-C-methyl-D-erythritol 4-phosphate cytidylyltransferase
MTSRAAVVTAAGGSARMGGGKKEYHAIRGRPVLVMAVGAFLETGLFSRLVVTLPPGEIDRARSLLAPHVDLSGIRFVEGGETRQESVRRALLSLSSDPPALVLIHDGARPWVDGDLIRRVLDAVPRQAAAIPVTEIPDAVKLVGASGLVGEHLARSRALGAQTPQGFLFAEILAAHEAARRDGIRCVDDAEVWERLWGPVGTVRGDPRNRKITFPHDIEEA